jgi:transposase
MPKVSVQDIVSALQAGETRTQIAARFRITYHSVAEKAQRWERTTGIRLPRARTGGNASPEQVESWRIFADAYRAGSSIKALSREHGLSRQRVHQILQKHAGHTGEQIVHPPGRDRDPKGRFLRIPIPT